MSCSCSNTSGSSSGDVPVVHESKDEIVWASTNRCSTLDACLEIGLDTRKVCRAVYEKSTQVLISRLDPQLRFLREYAENGGLSYTPRSIVNRGRMERGII
jgi:hypothetical protein